MSYFKNCSAAFILILSLSSCNKYDANGKLIKDFKELNKTSWLLGEWIYKDSIGTLKEEWKNGNDSTYIGTSLFILEKGDTIHSETMTLTEVQEHLIYAATVKGENNNDAVPFLMIKNSDSALVFENIKHDYPRKIQYTIKKNGSLIATISGTQNSKKSSETYQLDRKK